MKTAMGTITLILASLTILASCASRSPAVSTESHDAERPVSEQDVRLLCRVFMDWALYDEPFPGLRRDSGFVPSASLQAVLAKYELQHVYVYRGGGLFRSRPPRKLTKLTFTYQLDTRKVVPFEPAHDPGPSPDLQFASAYFSVAALVTDELAFSVSWCGNYLSAKVRRVDGTFRVVPDTLLLMKYN